MDKADIGSATVYRGDALQILPELEPSCLSAIISDPPYASGGIHRGDRTKSPMEKYFDSRFSYEGLPDFIGDARDQRGHLAWSTLWLSLARPACRKGAPVCIFSDWRQLPLTTDFIQAAGFVWRGISVWNKGRACRPMPGRFRPQCEYVVWGSLGKMPLDRPVSTIDGCHTIPLPREERFHLTAKPVDLMRQINAITEPGGVILDPFMGAGATGVAAVQQGFRFIGIEFMPENFDIACRRLEDAQRMVA